MSANRPPGEAGAQPAADKPDAGAEPTVTHDFEAGEGPVPGRRHRNPDGSQGGWVTDTATVAPTAYVGPSARVSGNAMVSGNAEVAGHAQVTDEAAVAADAQVTSYARVSGNAEVAGDAMVYGDARVSDGAWVFGDAGVHGDAKVGGKDRVYDRIVDGKWPGGPGPAARSRRGHERPAAALARVNGALLFSNRS